MGIWWTYAVLAGVLATALMTVGIVAGRLMGLATDMVRLLGLFFVSDQRPRRVYGVGLVVHFGIGAVFGIVYALLLTALGMVDDVGGAAVWGSLFGLVHGVIVGVALGALSTIHPRIGPHGIVEDPGFFGYRVGLGMPVAVLIFHVVYGVVASVTYSVSVIG